MALQHLSGRLLESIIWWYEKLNVGRLKKQSTLFLRQASLSQILVQGVDGEIWPSSANLEMLYKMVRKRRPSTVLEFGVGFSTIIMARALKDNFDRFSEAGHLYVVDSNADWIDNTKRKLPVELAPYVTFHLSTVSVIEVNSTLAHCYDDLPNICPDFVFVDGPDYREVTGNIRGLDFSKRPTIGADLLLYESSAALGLFIMVDGRVRTLRFLTQNLQRTYRYKRYRSIKGYRKTCYTLEHVGL